MLKLNTKLITNDKLFLGQLVSTFELSASAGLDVVLDVLLVQGIQGSLIKEAGGVEGVHKVGQQGNSLAGGVHEFLTGVGIGTKFCWITNRTYGIWYFI